MSAQNMISLHCVIIQDDKMGSKHFW